MLPTGLGAFATVLRDFIIAEPFARIRTGRAHGGTCFTGMRVKRRTAQDETRRGVADLDAILQQPDVFGCGVFPAFFQTVLDRVEAGVVAFFAGVKTLVQLFRQVFVNIVHNFPFVSLFMFRGRHPSERGAQPQR